MPLEQKIVVRAECSRCGEVDHEVQAMTSTDGGPGSARDALRERGWLIKYGRLYTVRKVLCPDCSG